MELPSVIVTLFPVMIRFFYWKHVNLKACDQFFRLSEFLFLISNQRTLITTIVNLVQLVITLTLSGPKMNRNTPSSRSRSVWRKLPNNDPKE